MGRLVQLEVDAKKVGIEFAASSCGGRPKSGSWRGHLRTSLLFWDLVESRAVSCSDGGVSGTVNRMKGFFFFDGLVVGSLVDERGDVVVVQCHLMTGFVRCQSVKVGNRRTQHSLAKR